MNRRKSREVAMKLLFEMSINKEEFSEILKNFKENTDTNMENVDFIYINKIVNGIEQNKEDIDKKIEENLTKWKLNRLSKIDLTILRISTYEIMFMEDIPNKVAVNEAIELAKKYSADNSPAFVNGVLGNMIKA
ncbi:MULTISPECIES: transcription antitermination factor NusB [Clostridium]|uniref:Transcription antitermination protein NusB n=1 Tax=Clostridium novyi (strain NT) TaxID=386415 RepID=NUSB_CLONN|nr:MULTISPECIES: transcription antitermination factor NusB [Clostridium]A0Q099.1 RecName: Full=Transcription antitermination protein NusB; AltName: Full=Antitermination factor NusB [Clostridium novyi NT]ABK61364.1 transcription antitermination factor NusB [Clostridium novyi NT]KEH85925.1 antitermination protein NusB [Clostridium novyi A str. NCTC 538]KEH88542.1 antitermination protein NusB [Clostridium novyi A str. BKT29909]KEH92797.1 antitermination protein NusB [Clostridium botulinum C/D str